MDQPPDRPYAVALQSANTDSVSTRAMPDRWWSALTATTMR